MDFIWQYGGCMMNINWPIIGILLGTVLIWWSIFTNGFIITMVWILVIGATLGLIIKLMENRY